MSSKSTAFWPLFICAALAGTLHLTPVQAAESVDQWRGLVVADELADCPDQYDRSDYVRTSDRPKLLPLLKKETMGYIFSPYTRRIFAKDGDVQVEHIIAAKQAHLSGLCKADNETRRAFATDLLNLTLAGMGLNQAKDACDAATWIPPENRCWFAHRVIEVRLKYALTIDRSEVNALESILSACNPGDERMNLTVQRTVDALDKWDTDGNGQIACMELRNEGVQTPINRFHPAWPFVRDKYCDGRACS